MKFVISGYYGFGNMGDEAILSVLTNELKERFPRVEIVVLSQTPEETAKQYGVRAINRWDLWQIHQELRKATAFLSGGGGLIQDRTSRRSALYYLSLIALAKGHCPVFVVGQGIGPLENLLIRSWGQRLLRRVDFAMVRDERSWQLLRGWGLSEERLSCGGDLALLLWPQCMPLRKVPDHRSSYWAFCLKGGLPRKWKGKLLQQLDSLSEQGEIVFFVLHPKDDLNDTIEMAKCMKQPSVVRTPTSLNELLKSLSQAKAVVGMRLHALLFSLLTARPFLALGDDPKINGFLRQIERAGGPRMPCWSPTQLETCNVDLAKTLAHLACGYEAQRERLTHAGEILYDRTHQTVDALWQRLSEQIEARGEAH